MMRPEPERSVDLPSWVVAVARFLQLWRGSRRSARRQPW